MRISVNFDEKVKIRFEGKVNMNQEVIISKDAATKLGNILTSKNSSTFDAE